MEILEQHVEVISIVSFCNLFEEVLQTWHFYQ